jgi:hypothetical protein
MWITCDDKALLMTSKSMRRAERAAATLLKGRDILETLKMHRRELVASAKQQRPPVSAVSQKLLDEFGQDIKRLPVKQFVGLAVRAILEEAGFDIAYSGVRISDDPVFTSGSVYKVRADESLDAPQSDDALERMLKGLTPEQATRATRFLRRHFPHVREEWFEDAPKTRTKPSKPLRKRTDSARVKGR